jgi:ABC-type transport system involved in multi-copper enzyme maturation permease subunit
MKLRAIAWTTFAALVRNKLIIVFSAIFACVLLLMLAPLGVMKSMAQLQPDTFQSIVLPLVGAIMGMLSGCGSLLAAWATADAVWGEMKSGTILAVMARPVHRWEFLLGKYLGVQMLMAIYVLFMFGMSYLLAWLGGGSIQSTPWVLIAYPLVRYAIYSAIAMLLVMAMHPVVAFGTILVVSTLAGMLGPAGGLSFLPGWLRGAVYSVLPSTDLLSETRFLTITQARLKQIPWADHATALAYGLDYALVFFLLAVWAFRRRGLARD